MLVLSLLSHNFWSKILVLRMQRDGHMNRIVILIEYYLEVNLISSEMQIKWIVHLHFHALRLNYSHILIVFSGMTVITGWHCCVLLAYNIHRLYRSRCLMLPVIPENYEGVPLHIIIWFHPSFCAGLIIWPLYESSTSNKKSKQFLQSTLHFMTTWTTRSRETVFQIEKFQCYLL